MSIREVLRFPSGIISAPPSKSAAHRVAICAALAGMNEFPAASNDDISATIECLKRIKTETAETITLNCRESGSTLRFLLPIAAALGVKAQFTGSGRLMDRPISELTEVLCAHGVEIRRSDGKIELSGQLNPGSFEIRGDVSSQYITGLLFALPLLRDASEITLTTNLESRGYVDMTADIMKRFGVEVIETVGGYLVFGKQSYKPADLTVEGDWSGAAFFLCASALGKTCTVSNLDTSSKQGDRAVLDILEEAGCEIIYDKSGITVQKPQMLRSITLNAGEIPDLVPPIAAMLTYARGQSRVENAGRLRLKESDRLTTVADMINAAGGDSKIEGDTLIINGKEALSGGTVKTAGDHRIAMSAAVLACRAAGSVYVDNCECVAKSFPDFWEKFEVI